MRELLTEKSIESKRWNKKSLCVYWDSVVPGLGLRVYPTGKKTWVICYNDHKKTKVQTLGSLDELNLTAARVAARGILTQYRKERKLLDRFSGAKSVEMVCREWLDRYAKTNRRSWAEDKRRLSKWIFPEPAAGIPLPQLSAQILRDIHGRISKTAPIEANRVIETIRAVWNRAKRWGYVSGDNPAELIDLNKERARIRWLTPEEIELIGVSLKQEEDPFVRAAFKLLFLTALRKNEVLNLKWKNVNLTTGQLTIEQPKTDDFYIVPLSPQALEVIKEIPRTESPFVIYGPSSGKRYDVTKAWRRIRTRAGITDVTVHDIRRTVASWMLQDGHSLPIIAKVLNHRSIATTKRYAYFADQNHRSALTSYGEKVFALIRSPAVN